MQWARLASNTLVNASTRGVVGTAKHLIGKESFLVAEARVPAKEFRLDQIDERALSSRAETLARELTPKFKAVFGHHSRYAYRPLHSYKEA